jgi:hypothetical protein
MLLFKKADALLKKGDELSCRFRSLNSFNIWAY